MIAHVADLDGALRVDFERARELILAATPALPAETVALEASSGRVLSSSLRAGEDIVPYARSGMDGYAVRANETAGADAGLVTLPVRGMTYAGDAPAPLAPGFATAIATGAALPEGADAVVPIECVEVRGDTIVIAKPLRTGDHVFEPGDDAKRGEVLVRAGDVVTAGRAGLLAAAGHAHVRVHRRPRVAIVCTGDEVVPIVRRPAHGQIRNSNAVMLAMSLARDGADIVFDRTVRDEPIALAAALREALACSDLTITTGGASVGERDLVKNTCVALGTRFAFRSVALRPSKPTAFGTRGSTLVAVLPGNPAAAFVAYGTLVRGVVRKLGGHPDPYPRGLVATLEGSIRGKAERHYVMFGRLSNDGAGYRVTPLENQCSSLVRTAADANALIVVSPGCGELCSGTPVRVEQLT